VLLPSWAVYGRICAILSRGGAFIRASVLVGPERSEIREVPVPPVGENDVLVRVEASGV